MKKNDLNTTVYVLPTDNALLKTSNILEHVNEVITDYLNLLKKDLHRGVINHLFGLNEHQLFSREDLANYYSLTTERIRQLRRDILNDLEKLLEGENNEKYGCKCDPVVSTIFNEIKSKLTSKKIFSKTELYIFFREEYDCDSISHFYPTIDILIELFRFVQCGKVESSFTKANLIITSPSEKAIYIKAAERAIRLLKKNITPMNEMQIIIEIKKTNKKVSNNHISDVINTLPEIEVLEVADQTLYQIKFEFLSRASDRAYRVLLEKGNPMYIDEIVSEINSQLVLTGTPKIYIKP